MASTPADINGEDGPAVDDQTGEAHSELAGGDSGLITDDKSCVTQNGERVEADGGQEKHEDDKKPSPEHASVNDEQTTGDCKTEISAAVSENGSSVSAALENDSNVSGTEREDATVKSPKQEQLSDENDSPASKQCTGCKPNDESNVTEKAVTEGSEDDNKRRASIEMSSSDGEPLSRMDSEDRWVSFHWLLQVHKITSAGCSEQIMLIR